MKLKGRMVGERNEGKKGKISKRRERRTLCYFRHCTDGMRKGREDKGGQGKGTDRM